MEYIRVVMLRPTLTDIPQHPMAEGYSVRSYRPGDRKTWVRVEKAADRFNKINGERFDREFGHDLPAMEKRCLFLLAADGREIGTATAWYDSNVAGKPWGRVHWVAIVPEFQGKGLAKPLMTAVMNLLKGLGHERAILTTQTPRIPAIKTYLDFGFVPDMTVDDARRAWSLVHQVLRHPTLDRVLG